MLKKIASLKIAALIGLFLIVGSPAQAQQCTCGQCYTYSNNNNSNYNSYNGYSAADYQQALYMYNILSAYSQYSQPSNGYSSGYNTGNSSYQGGSSNTYHRGNYTDASTGGDGTSSGFYAVGRGWSY